MSRLVIETRPSSDRNWDSLALTTARRIKALPADQCAVEYTASLLRLFLSESCGKCTPCRVGLAACVDILDRILAGEGEMADLEQLRATAQTMFEGADCAIGFESGRALLAALDSFKDFESHIEKDACNRRQSSYSPCQALCPAHVDVPGYVACIREGRPVDALRVLRNDNPLPTVCGYVCEHPCEMACRRTLVDDPVNICGLKRYAADVAEPHNAPECLPSTGKNVCVVGGGPAGLTAAYYMQLMGHQVTILEQRNKLGGMVRYGIPDYRLPQERLDADIDFILSTGVKAETNISIGKDKTYEDLAENYDAIYLAIGAHSAKSLRLEGEDAKGVLSAVEFLRAAGDGMPVDLAGKRVVIVGGGNVAMDCTRTARRLGAETVECVYRRRIVDMTALAEEIEEAMAEGCQITELEAPVRIETDADGNVAALITKPQVIGGVKRGRPAPYDADAPERRIDCDIILVAIGQAIDTEAFAHVLSTEWGCIVANPDSSIEMTDRLFAGGDAVSGPATVIKAIAAGKVAAANIDAALGYHHNVYDRVDIPATKISLGPTGRVELKNMNFGEAIKTFDIAKLGMSEEEALQEASRCLRCDHHGFGATCTRRELEW